MRSLLLIGGELGACRDSNKATARWCYQNTPLSYQNAPFSAGDAALAAVLPAPCGLSPPAPRLCWFAVQEARGSVTRARLRHL